MLGTVLSHTLHQEHYDEKLYGSPGKVQLMAGRSYVVKRATSPMVPCCGGMAASPVRNSSYVNNLKKNSLNLSFSCGSRQKLVFTGTHAQLSVDNLSESVFG